MLNKSYVFYYISLGNREIEKSKLELPRFLESVLDGFEERSYKPSHKVQLLEVLLNPLLCIFRLQNKFKIHYDLAFSKKREKAIVIQCNGSTRFGFKSQQWFNSIYHDRIYQQLLLTNNITILIQGLSNFHASSLSAHSVSLFGAHEDLNEGYIL